MSDVLTDKYQTMVGQLVKPGEQIQRELSPAQANALHMAVGAAGEAGELLDAIKRWTIYQKPLDRKNVIEELGDIEFFLEGLRQELQISRDETLVGNMQKLSKRYHQGSYSNEQAQQRADKQAVGA